MRRTTALKYLDGLGLDIASTARALDISEVAVRVARHRGLRRPLTAAEDPQPTSARSRSRSGSGGSTER